MSIATEITRLQTAKADLKTAIEGKGVTVPSATKIDGYADLVDSIQMGGGGGTDDSHDQDDVIFIDYDGTVLYYYTAQEFAALTELPPNPIHSGLSAQGWNWSLADAQSYVSTYGRLTIGQSYITDDGKNRFYIHVPTANKKFYINWSQSLANGVELDWGDGSAVVTVSNTGQVGVQEHTFSSPGDYCITLERKTGSLTLVTDMFTFINACHLMVYKIELGNFNVIYNSFNYLTNLKHISFPAGIITDTSALFLAFCPSLKAFVVPDGVTRAKRVYGSVRKCGSLKFYSLPKSITSNSGNSLDLVGLVRFEIPPSADDFNETNLLSCKHLVFPSSVTFRGSTYRDAQKMEEIIIPSSMSDIPSSFANGAAGVIVPVTIPANITSISQLAFTDVRINEYHLLPETPPTLGNANAIPKSAGLKIYVPYSSDHSILEAYKTATNWSGFESYIEEEPQ